MKPLAIFKYYANNTKKFLSVFATIVLSVFLLYTVQMLIDSSFQITQRAFVQPQKYYSSVTAKAVVLDESLVNGLKAMNSLEDVLPWVFHFTNFYCSIGGNTGTKVFTMKCKDIPVMMSTLHLKVKKGRLPKPGTNEIALHALVAANKGLKIGDKIGSNIQKDEVIQGERVIVGLLEGESIVSFDSLEYWMEENNSSYEFRLGAVLLPKEGKEGELYKQLNEINTIGLEVRTYPSVYREYTKDSESILILLTMINIMVILIVSICIGFLSYIYFSQRRGEFGILSAIGYTRQQIIYRAFAEITGMNLLGLSAGVLLSVFTGTLLNLLSFSPRGEPLELLNPDYILHAACIPLFIVLFSILPVWRMLKELDPVTIIERGM